MTSVNIEVRPEYPVRWSEAVPEQWGTCVGAWGDCLIDYGTFRQKVGTGGIICWTEDPAIPEFLRLQHGVSEVRWLKPSSHDEYLRICRYMADSYFGPGSLNEFADRADIDVSLITHTSMGVTHDADRPASHWHGSRLSREAVEWALSVAKDLPDRFYILNPVSLNSTSLADHWMHWTDAVTALLEHTPWTYVMVGHGWSYRGSHERVVDLVGKSPNLTAVFALAEMSSGVITTSSGLSHYSVVQSIPACVLGNRPLCSPGNFYFKRWLEAPNVKLVRYDEGLDAFIAAANQVVA